MGLGLGAGLGMALAEKLKKSDARIFVVMGDGEIQEGAVWEAASAAVKYRLDHLTAVLD
ncbi:1-deoxy-D-xylulose-5-phosphate synthase N-terminal domain-containing protein, partial [Hungatella hathewayi]|uniref:1-deoxy-D-xylulose-5-phosphate synthase N-terminal domain-containing protein n=1 Tax=Hungatella hathewayi TaxID=154046 RepID=UPI0032E4E320